MAPPAQGFDSSGEIARLRALRSNLYGSKSLNDKLRAIDVDSKVKIFFSTQRNGVSRVLGALDLESGRESAKERRSCCRRLRRQGRCRW
ncbi:hypothetical protein U1Q18_006981 [Sarracenia purpurea var. burkii]